MEFFTHVLEHEMFAHVLEHDFMLLLPHSVICELAAAR